ncbi:MAG: RNA polymerase subunit sigma-70 [Acidobacteria bacterium]|nr:MAG: RNA polymerase subunit sigma-70 [Acidobacteriota bacterium]REK03833.1 MAG: RNA polymerase subunit sigma-70 [Acidobacteriota bacterium]
MSTPAADLTATLLELGSHSDEEPLEDREVLDRLVPAVYDELRRVAHLQIRRGGGLHTLDTTGLVHETYLRLVQAPELPLRSRSYFFGAATRAMRNVLVDAARRRGRKKRGAGERPATLDEELTPAPSPADTAAAEILELDTHLERLAREHPRPARVLECRVFGGLTVEETAQTLEMSARSVNRDTAFARAWLRREMKADVASNAGGDGDD